MNDIFNIVIFLFLIALHIILPTLFLYKKYIISKAQCVYILKVVLITILVLLGLFILWVYS